MKNICLIPARGGSKRIPRKNIRLFNGKPLIAWSIECAIASDLFEQVYVSTDDSEISEISQKYGANVPFKRPASISDDFSSDKHVRDHFLDWIDTNQIPADFLCYLYPTAPLITNQMLRGCLNLLIKSEATEAFVITKFSYPILRALNKEIDDSVSFNWPKYTSTRSQDLPEFYHDAGQFYFFNLNKYSQSSKRVGYEVPRILCHDIDTIEDFEYAELLFKVQKNIK